MIKARTVSRWHNAPPPLSGVFPTEPVWRFTRPRRYAQENTRLAPLSEILHFSRDIDIFFKGLVYQTVALNKRLSRLSGLLSAPNGPSFSSTNIISLRFGVQFWPAS